VDSIDDIFSSKHTKKIADYDADDDYGSGGSVSVSSETFSAGPSHGHHKFIRHDREGKYIDEYETNY
jgi:hypothetical protein